MNAEIENLTTENAEINSAIQTTRQKDVKTKAGDCSYMSKIIATLLAAALIIKP